MTTLVTNAGDPGAERDDLPAETGAAVDDALADARRRWRDLVGRALPAAAASRDWPIRADHCFARVILDAVCGRPWREVVAAPAWRHLDPPRLAAAIALAEEALAGAADLHVLNAQSLAGRGKPARRR